MRSAASFSRFMGIAPCWPLGAGVNGPPVPGVTVNCPSLCLTSIPADANTRSISANAEPAGAVCPAANFARSAFANSRSCCACSSARVNCAMRLAGSCSDDAVCRSSSLIDSPRSRSSSCCRWRLARSARWAAIRSSPAMRL